MVQQQPILLNTEMTLTWNTMKPMKCLSWLFVSIILYILLLQLSDEVGANSTDLPSIELDTTTVSNLQVYEYKHLKVTGDLTIAEGGELVLKDSRLTFMNYTSTPQFEVFQGGKISVYNSSITSISGFNWIIRGKGIIEKSELSGLTCRDLDLEIPITYQSISNFSGGGVEIYSSQVFITNSTFIVGFAQNALTIFESSPIIMGNSFNFFRNTGSCTSSKSSYIMVWGGSPNIYQNTFYPYYSLSHGSLFFYQTNAHFYNNTILEDNFIIIVDSSPEIDNNSFYGNSENTASLDEFIGIARFSNPSIYNNYFDNWEITFFSVPLHFTLFQSKPSVAPFRNNTFFHHNNAFSSYPLLFGYGDFMVIDSTFIIDNSPKYYHQISLKQNASVTVINSTFSPEVYNIFNGTLTFQSFLKIKVVNQDDIPVNNALVDVLSSQGLSIGPIITNTVGLTPRLNVPQESWSRYTPYDWRSGELEPVNIISHNPYTVSVELNNRKIEKQIWVNQSSIIEIILPDLPDLIITTPNNHIVDSWVSPLGRPHHFLVSVTNIGSLTAPVSLLTLMKMYNNEPTERLLENFTIPSLESGESYLVLYNYTPTVAGTINYLLLIDPDGIILETDETNNEAVASVTVVYLTQDASSFYLRFIQHFFTAALVSFIYVGLLRNVNKEIST